MKYFNDKAYSLLTILSVLLLGLLNLPTPLFGDQAFFLLGAKEMNEGFVLYRDFWDVKQPGIFFFFLAGGKTFGFTETGIHLFELFYWLLFTITLIWFLKKYRVFKYEVINYLIPLTIVGTYVVSSIRSVTQVEALVNFPLLLVVIFNTLFLKSLRYRFVWVLLSGLAGGLVLYFKIIFAPILLMLWFILFIKEYRSSRVNALLLPLAVLAGILISWLPFVVYCYSNNILELCYHTFFTIPPLILKYGEPKSVSYLMDSAGSFFLKFILFIPFVLFSLSFIKKRFLTFEMWGWLFAATIVILFQRNSWYTYHFQIIYTPLVFLALQSIDFIVNKYDFNYRLLKLTKAKVLIVLLILINTLPILYLGKKVLELSRFNFAITREDRINYAITHTYNAQAYRISSLLNVSHEDEKCPIFVVNDPLVYYYTGRNQATAQNGWSMQLFIPGQLEILCNELKNTKPCYIFIYASFNEYFACKGLKIMNWIKEHYVVFNASVDGIWYKIN